LVFERQKSAFMRNLLGLLVKLPAPANDLRRPENSNVAILL